MSTPIMMTTPVASPSNTFGPYTSTIQNLLSYIILNDNEHQFQKEINDSVINLFRCLRNTDMLLELERAITSRNTNSNCVTVSSNNSEIYLQYCNTKLPAHIFSARLWRWHDFNPNSQHLKSTQNCKYHIDMPSEELCINPYHYDCSSSLVAAQMPPTPNMQQIQAASALFNSDAMTNIVNTVITHSDVANLAPILESAQNIDPATINQFSVNHPYNLDLPPIDYIEPAFWCTISYYELNHQVNPQYHASQPYVTIDGFVDPSSPERFCLGVLTNVNRTLESEQCRRLIGRGVRLYYIGGEIFAECLSDQSIFVQSPISNILRGWHPATVCRLSNGCNIKIFNNREFANLLTQTVPKGFNAVFQLTRMCTIRISFAKGWGNDYRRQAITSTPCWIEIRLNGPFQWLDRILAQMNSPGILSS